MAPTYHDWLRSQIEAEYYWFPKIDPGDGLVTPGWSDPETGNSPTSGSHATSQKCEHSASAAVWPCMSGSVTVRACPCFAAIVARSS
jgi:hypothetical protein